MSLKEAGTGSFIRPGSEDAKEEKDSKDRLGELLDSITDAFYTLDANWRLTYVNHRTEEWWQRLRKEIVGTVLWDLFPDQENTIGWLNLHKAMRERIPISWEGYSSVIHVWVEASAYPICNGGLVVNFKDITDRKKAEEMVRSSEEQFRRAIEDAPIPIIMQTEDGEVIQISKTWTELTGYTISDIRCFNEWVTKAVYGEGANKVRNHLYDLFNGQNRSVSIEFEVRSVDGELRHWCFSASSPGILGDGRRFIVGMAVDITERKRAEENLKRSNEELQQFAFVASHDLQEPLRMVTSYLGLLNKKYGDELSPQAKEYMSFAVDGSMRMKSLIDDLLAFSRIDSQSIVLEEIDMNEKARAVIEDLHVAIRETGAEVIVEPLPIIRGEKTQMKQLMTNLLSNAIKFRGETRPRIEVSAVTCGNDFVFTVKDNGIGIDPRFADKLFKMFSRLHTREEYPGTGIGLAISKKIVERHGGRIWFESEPGKGTIFFFTIPIR